MSVSVYMYAETLLLLTLDDDVATKYCAFIEDFTKQKSEFETLHNRPWRPEDVLYLDEELLNAYNLVRIVINSTIAACGGSVKITEQDTIGKMPLKKFTNTNL